MDTIDRYLAVIDKMDGVEKKGKTMPYTSSNGYMFSFIDKEDKISLRLSEEDRAVLLDEHGANQSVQHGRIMKEFVCLPNTILAQEKELLAFFEKSYNYTNSLKPK